MTGSQPDPQPAQAGYAEASAGGIPPELEPVQPGEGLSRTQLQTRAVHGAAATSLMTVLLVPLALVGNVAVARGLGATEYGELAVISAVFVLGVQVANAGVSSGVVQWGSAAAARGDDATADLLLRRILGFHILVEFPLLAALGLYLFRDEPPLVGAGYVLALGLTLVLGGGPLAITIENRTDTGARIGFFSNALSLIATAATALAVRESATTFVARLVTGVLTLPLYLRALSTSRRRATLLPAWPWNWPPGLWRFSLFSCGAGLVTSLVISRSEIFLLEGLESSTAVGVFALAYGLSYQITAPVDALLHPLTPAVSGLLERHPEEAQRALLRALRYSSLAAAAVLVVLVPPIIHLIPTLYGDDFSLVSGLLLPLAAVSCFQSACHPVTAFVTARRAGARLLANNLFALVVNLAVAVPAILLFGVWGAVIGNVLGQLALLLAFLRSERADQDLPWRVLARSFGALWLALAVAAAVTLPTLALLRSGVPALLLAAATLGVSVALFVGLARQATLLSADDRLALLPSLPATLRRPTAIALRWALGSSPAPDREDISS